MEMNWWEEYRRQQRLFLRENKIEHLYEQLTRDTKVWDFWYEVALILSYGRN